MNIIFLPKNLKVTKKPRISSSVYVNYFEFCLEFFDLLIFFPLQLRKRLLKEVLLEDKLDWDQEKAILKLLLKIYIFTAKAVKNSFKWIL